jgi:Ser/Thr protein kinase RdoA (MazF antagonist)
MPRNTSSPLAVIASQPPQFSIAAVRDIATGRYGLGADVEPLVSERDQNFRLRTAEGVQYVMKIANAAEDPKVTNFQIQALLHIETKKVPDLAVPRILPTRDGKSQFVLQGEGGSHVTRVVSYLAGEPLDAARLSAPLCRNLGASLARLGHALCDFRHPGESQALMWDMKQAPLLRDLLTYISNKQLRSLVAGSIDAFVDDVWPRYPGLRQQVIHNDLNPANILIDSRDRERVAGIIDFGDMLYAPLAVDIAVAAAYLRIIEGDPLTWVAEFVAGYHHIVPLQLEEIDLLYDLINTRLAATVAILNWRVAERDADDEYLSAAAASESTAGLFLARLRELPRRYVSETLRQVCASAARE